MSYQLLEKPARRAGRAYFLLPSFLHGLFSSTEPERKRQTDYLDGLRGVASFFVFVHHWSRRAFPHGIDRSFGANGENHSFFQLPIIRLMTEGSAMVAIFFVISGYVLSHRCLMLIRSKQYDRLLNVLASSTFRRAMRLFLPSFISSLMAYICQRVGWLVKPNYISTFMNDTKEFALFWWHLSSPWTWNEQMRWYDSHLWTIPIEFRASIVLFVVILGLSRLKAGVRIFIAGTIVVYCFLSSRWDVALFIGGMMIAEMNIITEENQDSEGHASHRISEAITTSLLCFLLFVGLFLASYPKYEAASTPGFSSWASLPPHNKNHKRRFTYAIAALHIVGPLSCLPWCQKIFTTKTARYLGKISYALYLVHGTLNRTVGDWLISTVGYWLASVAQLVIVIWFADVFWRVVDVKCVKFAKWIEARCLYVD